VTEDPGSDDALHAGQEALERGAWEEARACFERALASAETPEALEGLSWGCWWLDDPEALFDARERAYRLYRERGDAADAARMATWLAVDHVDFRGELAVATGWMRRAHRLLDPIDPGPEHGWLAMHEGYLELIRGNPEAARELGRRSAELGRALRVPDLEMLGLALKGSTLVGSVELGEGMRRLDEATALALEGEATIPISGAWACCFMVSACTRVRDFERACEWCDRIAEFAERYRSRYMLAFCRAEYGAVYMWRGQWSRAEAVLEASIEDFSRSRPALVGGPLVALAELRRRQGRTEEAVELLDRAGPSEAAELPRARLELDRGRVREAAELLDRQLRKLPSEATDERLPALELLVRARAGMGDLDAASSALAELQAIEARLKTPPLRAASDLAGGIVRAAAGEHDPARILLEDAVDRFERCGAPFESAQARLELAQTLLALGRIEEGRREAAAARESLAELGAAAEAARADRFLAASSDVERNRDAAGVTAREREVLTLLAEGLTNRQIAERLVLSEHTVHRHVTNILRKLELPSRAAAAAHAARSGLLEHPADAVPRHSPCPGE
jgi:LuxR family transcriptional regulator, maltose regulon positive regulatory protein